VTRPRNSNNLRQQLQGLQNARLGDVLPRHMALKPSGRIIEVFIVQLSSFYNAAQVYPRKAYRVKEYVSPLRAKGSRSMPNQFMYGRQILRLPSKPSGVCSSRS
jgi:hypothetical protein